MNPFLRLPSVRTLATTLGLLALTGWLAGCATTPEEPILEANLVNLHFTDATVFETVAVAEVRLTNLTGEDVRVTGAAHKVTVNGTNLGRGVSAAALTVPRLGSATQQVEFHLRNLSLARTIHELTRTHVLDYHLDGTVYAAQGAGRERGVKVRRDGQVDLNQLAPPPSNGAR